MSPASPVCPTLSSPGLRCRRLVTLVIIALVPGLGLYYICIKVVRGRAGPKYDQLGFHFNLKPLWHMYRPSQQPGIQTREDGAVQDCPSSPSVTEFAPARPNLSPSRPIHIQTTDSAISAGGSHTTHHLCRGLRLIYRRDLLIPADIFFFRRYSVQTTSFSRVQSTRFFVSLPPLLDANSDNPAPSERSRGTRNE
ncbi:hypothetical protein Bbelb_398410 [Branchiostoma belcheri]|nr:hypothetical protein Bbelb_398410 [Branchiostoma belcheri]